MDLNGNGNGYHLASRANRSTRDNTGLILFDALHGYLHPSDPKKVAFLAERNILQNLQRLLAAARQAGLDDLLSLRRARPRRRPTRSSG